MLPISVSQHDSEVQALTLFYINLKFSRFEGDLADATADSNGKCYSIKYEVQISLVLGQSLQQ